MHAFATRARRRVPLETPPLHVHLRQADRRTRALRIPPPPTARGAPAGRTGGSQPPPSSGMFVAETRLREFCDSSLVRTDARSCAEIEGPRARVPCILGNEFSPATAVRADALKSKRTRSLGAYGVHGNRRSSGETPRWYVEDQLSGAMHRPTSLLWIPAG